MIHPYYNISRGCLCLKPKPWQCSPGYPEGCSSLSAAATTASALKPSHASMTSHMCSSREETSGGEPLGACNAARAGASSNTQQEMSAI